MTAHSFFSTAGSLRSSHIHTYHRVERKNVDQIHKYSKEKRVLIIQMKNFLPPRHELQFFEIVSIHFTASCHEWDTWDFCHWRSLSNEMNIHHHRHLPVAVLRNNVQVFFRFRHFFSIVRRIVIITLLHFATAWLWRIWESSICFKWQLREISILFSSRRLTHRFDLDFNLFYSMLLKPLSGFNVAAESCDIQTRFPIADEM